jgi:hypothetical protein
VVKNKSKKPFNNKKIYIINKKEDYRSPFKKGGLVKSGKPKIATKGWK